MFKNKNVLVPENTFYIFRDDLLWLLDKFLEEINKNFKIWTFNITFLFADIQTLVAPHAKKNFRENG